MISNLQSIYPPYSANDLLAVVFVFQTFFFCLAYKRTGERYFLSLSMGTLLGCIAWGTTRLQSLGQPYLDWAWTGIPAVIITQTILTASLLRDRQQLKQEVEQRRQAEAAVLLANASLERKVMERTAELQNVIHALESFNRNVSHDLRGPLGGIDMLAFTARQQLDHGHVEAAQHQLQLISDQVRESQSTISSMLLLAKTYQQDIQITTFDLDEVVRSAAREAYMSLMSGQAARCMPEMAIQELGMVQADASILRIIFVNLITNALKFNMNRPDVKVEVGRVPNPDGHLQLFVRDNGVGFAAAETALAFQAFRRFSNASKVAGFGLGLSIVRLAVDRLGGNIEVQSSPGQGACFSFNIPPQNKTAATNL